MFCVNSCYAANFIQAVLELRLHDVSTVSSQKTLLVCIQAIKMKDGFAASSIYCYTSGALRHLGPSFTHC